jgi:hypothetical protein
LNEAQPEPEARALPVTVPLRVCPARRRASPNRPGSHMTESAQPQCQWPGPGHCQAADSRARHVTVTITVTASLSAIVANSRPGSREPRPRCPRRPARTDLTVTVTVPGLSRSELEPGPRPAGGPGSGPGSTRCGRRLRVGRPTPDRQLQFLRTARARAAPAAAAARRRGGRAGGCCRGIRPPPAGTRLTHPIRFTVPTHPL